MKRLIVLSTVLLTALFNFTSCKLPKSEDETASEPVATETTVDTTSQTEVNATVADTSAAVIEE